MYSDNTTRIHSIWDQTIISDGNAPEGFHYGTEYTETMINEALASENPWSVVPSRDTNGHGTFMAGVIAGRIIEEQGFSGVAPLADICVVKCREAKRSLKNFYNIETDEVCYSETDILLGVKYLYEKAVEAGKPIAICLGMGTSLGGHDRGGILGEYLQNTGDNPGVAMVTACGNEANTAHHYRSDMVDAGETVNVEIRVGGASGFCMELWADAPQLYSVGLVSPGGEYSGKILAKPGESREINFILEETIVEVEFFISSYESGDECIQFRVRKPTDGVWTVQVYKDSGTKGIFDIWLPISNFLSVSTYFLKSDPDVTLCEPSNNLSLISPAFFNSDGRSVAINSSRGYTRRGYIKPDFASPGINIYGPVRSYGENVPVSYDEKLADARYEYRSGSSAATAITTGAACLMLEWGIVDENDVFMDSVSVQKYLIRGLNTNGLEGHNRFWGNGTLDVYGVFSSLRPKP